MDWENIVSVGGGGVFNSSKVVHDKLLFIP